MLCVVTAESAVLYCGIVATVGNDEASAKRPI